MLKGSLYFKTLTFPRGHNVISFFCYFGLPCGVGDVNAPQVDTLTAHDEERGEAEQGHSAADHGQLGRLASTQLQLHYDISTQHDAHTCTGHDDHS